MQVYYNPLDRFHKSITGAFCTDREITFRVKGDFDSVVFLFKSDKDNLEKWIEMDKKSDFFEISLSFSVGLYFYCFSIGDGKFIGEGKKLLGEITTEPKYYQLSAHAESFTTPEWVYGGVIYQIFPDRFYSANKDKNIQSDKVLHKNWGEMPVFEPNEFGQVVNNDFFGGDINGIIEKLDYLSDLGITIIYLNPIFKAFSNHRYDTGDYMSIDPLLGDEKDFINLIEFAKERGIKIILDGVFNHTGDDSIYFNKYGNYDSIGAYQSKDSPYYGWYNFTNFPNEYDAWWGIKILPAINENNSSYIDFITGKGGVLEKYTKMGIGGWRLDVVDELPSHFVKSIRKAVKGNNPNALIIGEVWEDASNKISYGKRREYFQGQELDSVMNYPLKNAILDFVKFGMENELGQVIKEQIDHYPQVVLHSLMNILSTHDTARLLTTVGGADMTGKSKAEMSQTRISELELDVAKKKLKVATLLQFTLCGVPSIYYGDEVGMQGYIDPLNRQCFPWGNEDLEIVEWYKFLISLRKTYDAFTIGEYLEIYCADSVLVYKRIGENSEVCIAVNVGDNMTELTFDGKVKSLLNGEILDKIELKKFDYEVFVGVE